MLLAWSVYLVVVSTRPENCYALKELTSFRTNNFEQRLLPSRFIADSKHFRSLQALHWFRWVLSMGHLPLNSPWALQVYTRLRWMLRLKNPEQPEKEERTGKIRIKPGREKKSLSKICLSAKTVKLFFSGKKVDFGLREKSSQGKWKERNWKRLKIELRRTIDESLWTEKWMFLEKNWCF